jgi:transcriptional regulator with XRE-family HTH domain
LRIIRLLTTPCQQESWNHILKKDQKEKGEKSLLDFVAIQIRELRTSYNSGEGLSQEMLASQLQVAPNTISRWETGVYRPSLTDLEKIARFFGVSMMTFLPPEMINAEDDNLAALLRTARQLHPADLEELRKYAEFRKARSIYQGKSRAKPGRKAVKNK